MASPEQVTAMAQQIKSVVQRDGWASDASVAPGMQQILGKLTTLKVDVELLKQTGIGAMVRKLTKHDDEIVRGYSTSLMNKWMSQVGMPPSAKDKPSASSSSQGRQATSSSSNGEGARFEEARKRLQQGYASEKAKRDSRTVQVLTRPVAKGRKGTTISAAPSRSSVAQNRLMQQRRTVTPPRAANVVRAASAPAERSSAPMPRRVMPTSQARRASPTNGVLSLEEQHRRRQEKLRAIRDKNLQEVGGLNEVYQSSARRPSPSASSSQGQRSTPNSARSSGSSSSAAAGRRATPEPPISDRKALLDKMFPRICGTSSVPPPSKGGAKKSPTQKGAGGAAGAKKKNVAYNEGQREVIAWLRGLEVDMSEYAPSFFDNGFDSIKLLGNIEKEDLPGLIPKKGHHRLIQQALDDLKRKHRTAASSRSHGSSSGSRRDRSGYSKRRDNPYSDEDSDDSFVVSDGDEYAPGAISAMFRKGRKRSYSLDSVDSYNMEASFDEIQHEEERRPSLCLFTMSGLFILGDPMRQRVIRIAGSTHEATLVVRRPPFRQQQPSRGDERRRRPASMRRAGDVLGTVVVTLFALWSAVWCDVGVMAMNPSAVPPAPLGSRLSQAHMRYPEVRVMPPVSTMCAFYEQQVGQEFIARMGDYDTLERHEQYVSSVLSDDVLPGWITNRRRGSSGTAEAFGVEIMQRSEFARLAPSDFVVFKLFTCSLHGSTRQSSGAGQMTQMCHRSEEELHRYVDLDDRSKKERIKYFQVNKVYREVELLQVPRQGSDPKDTIASTTTAASRRTVSAIAKEKRQLRNGKLRTKPKSLTEELGIKAMRDNGYTGHGVKIGVFDTGLSNSRFQNVKERINWTHEKQNEDLVGHGTFVAGVISGSDSRCPGIAPDADLYVFRMFTTDQLSFTSWFLDAFNYALFQGIHTLNLSTGGPDFRDRPFVEKIQELAANGVIIVSAVGNSGPKYGTLTNPADQMEVIGVGGITRDGDVADFSSRGMTTWELPFGSGRVKPDIVTLSEDIPGFDVSRGCTLLSGTSVSAPIVTGSIALLASMIPAEHRWSLLNPASVKQILIKSADRLEARYDEHEFVIRNHIFEQGNGKLNITRASDLVRDLWANHQADLAAKADAGSDSPQAAKPQQARGLTPSSYPESIDATNCPYMWPLCSQPLYHNSLPLMVNLTILNPASISGTIEGTPKWIGEQYGDHLTVSVALPDAIWPYFGSIGVFVEVKATAAAFRGVVTGSLSLSIRNGKHLDEVRVPIKVAVIPTPPPAKRILWDQFHNIPYPSAFVPGDKLENHHELLDSAGDHPHTNFHQLWNFLIQEGYFIEILPFEYSCMNLQQYGVVLLVDPEEEYFHDEIVALHQAIKYANVSLLVFADWYDDQILDTMDMFDTSTLSNWHAITGGANIPALNNLLRDFNIEFGNGAVSSSAVSLLSIESTPSFPYWSGSYLTKFPVGGYLGRIDVFDQSAMMLNQTESYLDDTPVLGLYQVPSRNGGRIAVFGDSSCIDASVHPASSGFQHCFDMVRSLLRFTNDGHLPESTNPSSSETPSSSSARPIRNLNPLSVAPKVSSPRKMQQLEHLDVEFIADKTSPSVFSQTPSPSSSENAAAMELRTMVAPPAHVDGRLEELKKHSKVLQANEMRPTRQSFCHFYRKQECNMATRVTVQVVEATTNVTRH
ncbi:Membrane-bound transcription factor site-1 protease, partial [Globisporangium splendens]